MTAPWGKRPKGLKQPGRGYAFESISGAPSSHRLLIHRRFCSCMTRPGQTVKTSAALRANAHDRCPSRWVGQLSIRLREYQDSHEGLAIRSAHAQQELHGVTR